MNDGWHAPSIAMHLLGSVTMESESEWTYPAVFLRR